MSLESVVIFLGYFGIFSLILINGIISFPSSQFIYIITGYYIYLGKFDFWTVVFLGAIANTIGNIILYEISRKKGLTYVLKFNNLIGLPIFREREINKIKKVFEKKRGYIFLFVGKFINPIKILIPIPAGISKMNRFFFGFIILITSFLWALAFVSLGYFFGKNFELFGYYGAIMLLLAGTFIYLFYRSMNKDDIIKELGK